ncbi:Man1a1 [Symbiodinium pilosum]|uniref:Man1a1 protein n=1 Tax=Symbiodinium pilosum TaxID=2952 RepID=A0A812SU50_SYMPI|nr:Man1a1 [Symbiodinium pilosum]
MFEQLDADKSGDLSEQEFQSIFSEFFVCVQPISMTEGMSISNGKSVVKLEVGMMVEALEMPQFDEAQKLTRLRCRVIEDSVKEGWVTMKGNQGKVFLSRQSPHNTALKSFARSWSAASKQVEKVLAHIIAKRKELASCSQGPLAEAREKLEQLKSKVLASQKQLGDLRKKVEAAKKDYEKCAEQDRKARDQAREKKLLAVVNKVLDEQVHAAESEAARLNEALAPLVHLKSEEEVLTVPTSLLKEGEQMNVQLKEKLQSVRTEIEKHEVPKDKGCSGQIQQAVGAAKWKVDNMEKETAKVLQAARATASRVADVALQAARAALRRECAGKETGMDAVFDAMRGDAAGSHVSREAFQRYLGSLPEPPLKEEQVSLVFDSIPGSEEGISRWSFLRSFQQFFVCQKSIALTFDFVISNCKPLRMLATDEVMEVLEGPQTDPKLGITRVKGRVLEHNVVGWATVSGNQGSVFLKEKAKPFMQCLTDLPLESNFVSSGEAPIRTLKAEEVLEVLEGPRKESSEPRIRARCRACSDDAQGWITLTGAAGAHADQGRHKHFTCKTAIAMTDNQNIKTCKVLRKLEVGEVVRVLEGPEIDKDSSVSRIKAVASKDSLEGWVTVKGNAGTVYAEEAPSLYTVLHEASALVTQLMMSSLTLIESALMSSVVVLTCIRDEKGCVGAQCLVWFLNECSGLWVQSMDAFGEYGGAPVRTLAKDEAIEVLEGPKEEVIEAKQRLKGRALADDTVGWVSLNSKKLRRWSPQYRCKQSTVLQDTLATKTAATVRRVEELSMIRATSTGHKP